VKSIIAINSVGSLREQIKQGDLIIPDQLIDRTKNRVNSFFGDGIVAHIQFAEPFCPSLRELLYETVSETGADVYPGGTYVVMEGPAFSTKAESRLHRSWGADLIGMTALPEARLAREAEICYAIVACATDYDVWHETKEDVEVEVVIQAMRRQEKLCKQVISLTIPRIATMPSCGCPCALQGAIITAPEAMPRNTRNKLELIISKYIG